MSLPAPLQYLDPLLDELVEMAVADARAILSNENGARYTRWLERQASRVPDFEIAPNKPTEAA